ncbi:hypothetical protein R5R35_002137 [Gryllus longicercus]|uniref:Mid1-interacting protein n=1 Tax=Gryllus longicercus TaxID=2509291 RepID=A0AAN9VEJ2_9ORTH
MLSDLTSNVYSDSIAFNMENRNSLRRIARHDDTEFSNQSIMNAMEKFVKAVNDMDETILVPCRLMDLKVGDDADTVPVKTPQHCKNSVRAMGQSDLFNLYTIINSVKNELLWGQNDDSDEPDDIPAPSVTTIKSSGMVTVSSSSSIASQHGSSTTTKGHARRPSTVSVASTNSAASISDSDSDNGIENDSGIEGEEVSQAPDYTQQVAASFRRHLCGLHRSLRQLTDAADYLTTRYQNDIGGAV